MTQCQQWTGPCKGKSDFFVEKARAFEQAQKKLDASVTTKETPSTSIATAFAHSKTRNRASSSISRGGTSHIAEIPLRDITHPETSRITIKRGLDTQALNRPPNRRNSSSGCLRVKI